MKPIKASEIAKALGQNRDIKGEIFEVVTDSRRVGPESLFVAIKGENADGNEFVPMAISRGAAMVVCERQALCADNVLVVPDSKRALIKIGGLYRSGFSIPFIGITGSVGKTTTKEFVHAVLCSKFRTLKNEGNQNNEIGVPTTLFSLTEEHEAAVIEMGMSGLGEISDLTRAVLPCIGVITNIGVSHLEALGTRENILKAKLEITEGMADESPLLLCGDDDLLNTVCNNRLKIYRYGVENPRNDVKAEDIIAKNGETEFSISSPWGNFHAKIPTIGVHNVKNALVAFSVGCLMGIEPLNCCQALSSYIPSGMRQRVVKCRGFTVVEDCYNCSPDSLRAAATALGQYPTEGRRILILSDMLELGKNEEKLHRECGEFLKSLPIDMVLGTGRLTRHTLDATNQPHFHFETKTELSAFLRRTLAANDVAWFKASRGMKLEDVIETVYPEDEKND